MAIPPSFYLGLLSDQNPPMQGVETGVAGILGGRRQNLNEDMFGHQQEMDAANLELSRQEAFRRFLQPQIDEQWAREAEQRKIEQALLDQMSGAAYSRDNPKATLIGQRLAQYGYSGGIEPGFGELPPPEAGPALPPEMEASGGMEFSPEQMQQLELIKAGQTPAQQEMQQPPAETRAEQPPDWLAEDMGERGLLPGGGGGGMPPDIDIPDVQLAETPEAPSMVEQPADPTAQEVQPRAPRGDRVLRGPGGNEILRWNPERHHSAWADRVREATGPMREHAKTPELQAIAETAIDFGAKFVEQTPGATVRDGAEKAEEWYWKAVMEAGKDRRAAMVAGRQATGAEDRNDWRAADRMDKLIKEVDTRYNIKGVQEALRASKKLKGIAQSSNPIEQRTEFGKLVKQIYGGHASDADRESIESSKPITARLTEIANKYTPDSSNAGQLSQEFKVLMSRLGETLEKSWTHTLQEAATVAARNAHNDEMITRHYPGDAAQRAYERVGGSLVRAPGGGRQPPAGGGAPKAAPKKSTSPQGKARLQEMLQ